MNQLAILLLLSKSYSGVDVFCMSNWMVVMKYQELGKIEIDKLKSNFLLGYPPASKRLCEMGVIRNALSESRTRDLLLPPFLISTRANPLC